MDLTEDDSKDVARWIAPDQRAAFAQRVAELTPAKGVLGDLALAFAACHGHLQAQRVVEKTLRESRQNVARIDADPSFLDEVHQVTLTRLLSPPKPRLASYSGLGPLGAWLRATAVRVAIDLRRGRARELPEESLETLIHVGPGRPDSAVRGLTATQVADAIRKALDTLSSRDRTLLRLHYFEGTTLEALARMYSVHRATVARWLSDAREVVLAQTRRSLSSRSGGDELEEVLGSVQSQLDVSFRQIFEGSPD
jgi:RNA polymerase sigma-70 factor, ECF subfamily